MNLTPSIGASPSRWAWVWSGQRAARANLQVYIDSAKARGDALDHVLFVGPPGLGKTTLAQIVARELGVNFRSTSGPVIAKAIIEDREVKGLFQNAKEFGSRINGIGKGKLAKIAPHLECWTDESKP